jgi:hypothetical protein
MTLIALGLLLGMAGLLWILLITILGADDRQGERSQPSSGKTILVKRPQGSRAA